MTCGNYMKFRFQRPRLSSHHNSRAESYNRDCKAHKTGNTDHSPFADLLAGLWLKPAGRSIGSSVRRKVTRQCISYGQRETIPLVIVLGLAHIPQEQERIEHILEKLGGLHKYYTVNFYIISLREIKFLMLLGKWRQRLVSWPRPLEGAGEGAHSVLWSPAHPPKMKPGFGVWGGGSGMVTYSCWILCASGCRTTSDAQ